MTRVIKLANPTPRRDSLQRIAGRNVLIDFSPVCFDTGMSFDSITLHAPPRRHGHGQSTAGYARVCVVMRSRGQIESPFAIPVEQFGHNLSGSAILALDLSRHESRVLLFIFVLHLKDWIGHGTAPLVLAFIR